jgi:hypothetical protein
VTRQVQAIEKPRDGRRVHIEDRSEPLLPNTERRQNGLCRLRLRHGRPFKAISCFDLEPWRLAGGTRAGRGACEHSTPVFGLAQEKMRMRPVQFSPVCVMFAKADCVMTANSIGVTTAKAISATTVDSLAVTVENLALHAAHFVMSIASTPVDLRRGRVPEAAQTLLEDTRMYAIDIWYQGGSNTRLKVDAAVTRTFGKVPTRACGVPGWLELRPHKSTRILRALLDRSDSTEFVYSLVVGYVENKEFVRLVKADLKGIETELGVPLNVKVLRIDKPEKPVEKPVLSAVK